MMDGRNQGYFGGLDWRRLEERKLLNGQMERLKGKGRMDRIDDGNKKEGLDG